VIPGDLGTQIAGALRAAAAAGEVPPGAIGLGAAGTWRPVPPQAGGAPGTYATSLPFALARHTGHGAAEAAAALAARLRGGAGIDHVSVTGGGYLTVSVTAAALTGLAARVVAAGPACAASDALSGTRVSVPGHPDLAVAASWEQAWQWVADEITGRLGRAAGAQVYIQIQAKRAVPPAAAPLAGQSTVAGAIAFAGADPVRYALAAAAAGGARAMGRQLPVPNALSDPFVAVRNAHADAASTLRWAAELGIGRGEPESLASGLLAHPRERELLAAISWLPERVAGAARRRQPRELAWYLEFLARAWLDCRESCPALPFGGQSAPRDEAGMAARLCLADATRTALAAALGLLGVAAPGRI
jgi:arginyl-tRNA synthetase